MKLKKFRKIIAIFILFFIIYFLCEYIFIPKTINLTAGEKYTINLNSPFNATIYPQTKQAIYINNTCVSGSKDISLNNEFQMICNKGSANLQVKFLGVPLKEVNINAYDKKKVYPVGKTAGICINTKGVLVLATGPVKDEYGQSLEPAKNIIKTGDIITEVNNKKVYSNNELKEIIKTSDKVNIKYLRNNTCYSVTLNTVKSSSDNGNKLGLWVRDSTQGIGTITYYDPEKGEFGALGHPITDVDTGDVIEINSGEIMHSYITNRQIGKSGEPGALIGSVSYNDTIGTINSNKGYGITGTINKDYIEKYCTNLYDIGYKSEVKKGEAYILANIEGDKIEKFKINIESINKTQNEGSKNFIIKITDTRLIEKTGGIVQGMSGCPIIQNGKIIGAVTHVFVNNPQKGYGIFLENMIKN